VAHGFGYGSGGEPATLNAGTLQFDHENYVSSLTMTAGTVTGSGEIRTTGGTYSTLAAASPSFINLNVNFVSAGTFNVARGTGAVDLQATGPASDTGNFTKSGAGIMAIGGNWANSGTTTVSAGTLQVDGAIGTNTVFVAGNAALAGTGTVNGVTTVQNTGVLAPGDAGIGTLSFAGALTLNAGSKAVLELTKTNSILTNDMFVVTSSLTLAGALTVTNIGTNALALGDSFTLFRAGSVSGNFSSKTLPALATNLVWDATQLASSGVIKVASIPVITNQPQSQVANPGNPVSFTVGATGTGMLAYQWLLNGTSIAGAVTNIYSIASAAPASAGSYVVIITNNFGAVTSSVAQLVVNLPPMIGNVSESTVIGFSLSATGAVGETCVLLGASNLVPPVVWLPLQTNTADANGVFNFTDAQATNFQQRFYQLQPAQ
jgi:autotransporter-associated beta strand protein